MQLVRNLACEFGHHNIRANAIAPGLIKTDFASRALGRPEVPRPLGGAGAAEPHW